MTSDETSAETGSHFDVAIRAFTAALGSRLVPGLATFPDLFTDDGVIEVPFDGDGTTAPIGGRHAVTAMVRALDGVLRFDEVTFSAVHDSPPATVVCEYQALLHRADLGGRYRRRYVSVLTLREGRIAQLREYGGPFLPAPG